MITVQNSSKQETFTALIEMGYNQEMVSLALKESKNKSLEEVLDLLTFREARYQELLKKTSTRASNSERKGSDSRYELSSDSVSKSLSSEDKKEVLKLDHNENRPSKDMDEKTAIAITLFIKAITNPNPRYVKDPNWLITDINDHLKDFKFHNVPAAKEVCRCLISDEYSPQISDLRNKLFGGLTKIMNMKVKKQHPLNIRELENVILTTFELKAVTPKQMETVFSTYTKLCVKVGVKSDENLVNILDKYCMDANDKENGFGPNLYKNDNSHLLEDPVLKKCTTVADHKKTVAEEGKAEINSNGQKDSPTESPIVVHHNVFEKESCIICMEKMREMVFLPCSHFLACPLCAPRIDKCPVCNKQIQKTLKIFWS